MAQHREAGTPSIEQLQREFLKSATTSSKQKVMTRLIAQMTLDASIATAQYLGCSMLRQFSIESLESCEFLIEAGAVETVIKAMRNHRQHSQIQTVGCLTLDQLTRFPDAVSCKEAVRRISGAAGVFVVLAAMRAHPAEAHTQTSGCSLLAHLIFINRLALVQAGAIETFMTALRAYQQDELLQSMGLSALCGLAAGFDAGTPKDVQGYRDDGVLFLRNPTLSPHCESIHARLVQAGMVPATLSAMRLFQASADIQLQGCASISLLVCDPDGLALLLKEGASELIWTAVRTHMSHTHLVLVGLQALTKLLLSSDTSLDATSPGIECVLSAMRVHKTNALLQQQAIHLLSLIWVCESGTRILPAPEGVPDAVITAMRAHQSSLLVQDKGCAVLALMSYDCSSGSVLAEVGAARAVIVALRIHGDRIQMLGWETLLALAVVASQHVVDAGGIPVIVKCMRAQVHVAAMLEKCCLILLRFFSDDSDMSPLQALFADTGAIECVAAAMQAHPDNAALQLHACQVLLAACWKNEANRILVCNELDAVVSAMRTHQASVDVVSAGCKLLEQIARVRGDEKRGLIISAGGLQCLLAAIKSFPNDGAVQAASCSALRRLARLQATNFDVLETVLRLTLDQRDNGLHIMRSLQDHSAGDTGSPIESSIGATSCT